MFVRVERGSSVPVSRQIADQIRAQCLSGHLPTGARLPSVRQLARELTVNQNTVLRVYERLTAENLLERRHGNGTFVAATVSRRALQQQTEKFNEEFQRLVREGRMLGLDDTQLQSLLDRSLSQANETAQEKQ